MEVPNAVYDKMLALGISQPAFCLACYAYRHGQHDGREHVVLRLPRTSIARATGMSRGTLLRAQSELEERGIAQRGLSEVGLTPPLMLPWPALHEEERGADNGPASEVPSPVQIGDTLSKSATGQAGEEGDAPPYTRARARAGAARVHAHTRSRSPRAT